MKIWSLVFFAAAAGLIFQTTGRGDVDPRLLLPLFVVVQISLLLSFLPARAWIFDRPPRRARYPNVAAEGLRLGAALAHIRVEVEALMHNFDIHGLALGGVWVLPCMNLLCNQLLHRGLHIKSTARSCIMLRNLLIEEKDLSMTSNI